MIDRRRACVFLGAGPVALSAARAAEPGVTTGEIVIGQNITLQGGKNAYGVEVLAGIKSLLADANRAGGVNNRRIVLRTLDDDNQNANAEANARKLVEGGAFILFGSLEGGPSTAVLKAADELKVPFFGPMAGSPNLRRPYQPLVFPVRAEHREEFRALIRYGSSIGHRRVAFFHADSEVGRLHLANVRLATQESAVEFATALPFKSPLDDTQIDAMVRQLAEARADLVLNHGSASLYERLIRKARTAGLKCSFVAVNSGSTQLAEALGGLAQGMVFAQVVPSPWARKTAIAREYQEAFSRANPGRGLSYGSMEGYLTAKALVTALRLAGPQPTRASFTKGLIGANFDLGGFRVEYGSSLHTGSTYVDLAMVTREGKFLQ